ncbi:hypothetical protein RRF57_008677 [Xylaria bambusicola]|uniref:Uncharacterized protein n=1 Tax=Xylaria bambusicola TaxID=326684 RepID=A0AAN7Z8H9_9PEZI
MGISKAREEGSSVTDLLQAFEIDPSHPGPAYSKATVFPQPAATVANAKNVNTGSLNFIATGI